MGRGTSSTKGIFKRNPLRSQVSSSLSSQAEAGLRKRLNDLVEDHPEDAGYYTALINKILTAEKFYHVAPSADRSRVEQHGLIPSAPDQSGNWGVPGNGALQVQPTGVYVTTSIDEASSLSHNFLQKNQCDIWEIDPKNIESIDPDFMYTSEGLVSAVIPHRIDARLSRRYEQIAPNHKYISPTLKEELWSFQDSRQAQQEIEDYKNGLT